jgi:hypothetical protein
VTHLGWIVRDADATAAAWRHLGLDAPAQPITGQTAEATLFEE